MSEIIDIETIKTAIQSDPQILDLFNSMAFYSDQLTNFNRLVEDLNEDEDAVVDLPPLLEDFDIVEQTILNREVRRVLRESFIRFIFDLNKSLTKHHTVSSPRRTISDIGLSVVQERLVDVLMDVCQDTACGRIENIKFEWCGMISTLERGALVADLKLVERLGVVVKNTQAMITKHRDNDAIVAFYRQQAPSCIHIFHRLNSYSLYQTAELDFDMTALLRTDVDDSSIVQSLCKNLEPLQKALKYDIALITKITESAHNDATVWHGISVVDQLAFPPSPTNPSQRLEPPAHLGIFCTPTENCYVIDSEDDDVVLSTPVSRLVAAVETLVVQEWIPMGKLKASVLNHVLVTEVLPRFRGRLGEMTNELVGFLKSKGVVEETEHEDSKYDNNDEQGQLEDKRHNIHIAIGRLLSMQQQIRSQCIVWRTNITNGSISSADAQMSAVAAASSYSSSAPNHLHHRSNPANRILDRDLLAIPEFVSMPLQPRNSCVCNKLKLDYAIICAVANCAWVKYRKNKSNARMAYDDGIVLTSDEIIRRARYQGTKDLTHASMVQHTVRVLKKIISTGNEGAIIAASVKMNLSFHNDTSKGESKLRIGSDRHDCEIFRFVYLCMRLKLYLDEGTPLPVAVEW